MSMLMIAGAIEQAISSHPEVAEACVVGIPDALKGHLPFAFVAPSENARLSADQLFPQIQQAVRADIGGISSLGGMIHGMGMIPKTRSGKTLRRVLRELVENASKGDFDKEVQIPTTIEDVEPVEVARGKIRQYFVDKGVTGKKSGKPSKL